jgi:fructokinase
MRELTIYSGTLINLFFNFPLTAALSLSFTTDCLADQLGKSKEEVTSWTPYPGGAPANVATGLARLGMHTIFLTALGQDHLGEQFIKLLKDRKVDTEYIQRNSHPTRDVLVTRSLDGDRAFAGFGAAKTTEYADCFVDASKLPLDVIAAADVLVTGTLGLAYPGSAAAIQTAVSAAKSISNNKEKKCSVIIDVNWRPVFWQDLAAAREIVKNFVPFADILKVTDEEAEWLFDIPATDALHHPEKVLNAVPKAQGVLVSAGEKGSAYAFRSPGGKMDISGIVPVLDVKVADTTGAGDAYLSGFIMYMLLSGGVDELVADPEKVQRAVQFATACGAATCTKPGAIDSQPTVKEAEALLQAAGWNT